MKFKKLRTRLLAFILPVIMLAMAVLTYVSATSSRITINDQIKEYMSSELSAQKKTIEEELKTVSIMANGISKAVTNTYKDVSMDAYMKMLEDMIFENEIVLGSGIWFEPNVYDATQKYMGPYVYKDGSKAVVTYDYSNKEYDYFSQEYYTLVKAKKSIIFTDPYYDQTSGLIMASCSAPLMQDGKFIGCVTVDIELSSIEKIVNDIVVGEGGSAMLVTSDGVFLGAEDSKKVQEGKRINKDENASLAKAGEKLLADKNGITSYKDSKDKEYNLYYEEIELGWKLIIQMPLDELNEPVNSLLIRLFVICGIAIVLSVIVVIVQVMQIASKIKKVQVFAALLSEGDFRIDNLEINSVDELGQMGSSLNNMYSNNKSVISNISDKALELNESSQSLSVAAMQMSAQFDNIEKYMILVNEDMMSASAATEEVNASVEEVNASVNLLAEKTEHSKIMSDDIKSKADEIQKSSQTSFDYATDLTVKYEKSLTKSIENAKVVENIGALADTIYEIAEQINLLSLNASIEAARAGEAGRGFAVVAGEIGKLANDTSKAVDQIQDTITKVHEAFKGLTEESKSILSFVQETVTPDYSKFVGVAKQYGDDALSIEENANNISDMADNIRHIMNEVSDAIQSIAQTSQNTADNSNKIMISVEEVSGVVDNVSGMSLRQKDISEELTDVVSNFKL